MLFRSKEVYGSMIYSYADFAKILDIEWINQVDNSDYATWQLMRNGCAYVVGNSSYSWWAARLSKCSDDMVIFPKPWFSSANYPREISPRSWKACDAHFLETHQIK